MGCNPLTTFSDYLASEVRFHAAAAHPRRLRMLLRLLEGPATAGELAELCGLVAASTSQHLAVLRDAGLVEYAKRGSSRVYRLVAGWLFAVDDIRRRWLAKLEAAALEAAEAGGEGEVPEKEVRE